MTSIEIINNINTYNFLFKTSVKEHIQGIVGNMAYYYAVYSITVRDGARVHDLRVAANSPLLDAIDVVVEGETEIHYITDSGTLLILQPEDTPSFLLMSLYGDNVVTVTSRTHARTTTSEEQESDSTGANDFAGSDHSDIMHEEDQESHQESSDE